jgi:hypothetical protein
MNIPVKRWFFLLPSLCVGMATAAVMVFPGNPHSTDVGAGLPSHFEPSGAAWNSRLNALFVCSDSNAIARLDHNHVVASWVVPGNWEGVAIADMASNLIYVVNEDSAVIGEFDFLKGKLTRQFDLTKALPAGGVAPLNAVDLDALTDGGDSTGIEALTFVPDAADDQGGAFFAGSQENGFIYKFRLPIHHAGTLTYLGKFKTWPADNTDLSGLDYDPMHHVLLAVWDGSDVIRAMTTTGTILHEWQLPPGSNDEEGIAFDGHSLFIAEDQAPQSEVWRYDGINLDLPSIP